MYFSRSFLSEASPFLSYSPSLRCSLSPSQGFALSRLSLSSSSGFCYSPVTPLSLTSSSFAWVEACTGVMESVLSLLVFPLSSATLRFNLSVLFYDFWDQVFAVLLLGGCSLFLLIVGSISFQSISQLPPEAFSLFSYVLMIFRWLCFSIFLFINSEWYCWHLFTHSDSIRE